MIKEIIEPTNKTSTYIPSDGDIDFFKNQEEIIFPKLLINIPSDAKVYTAEDWAYRDVMKTRWRFRKELKLKRRRWQYMLESSAAKFLAVLGIIVGFILTVSIIYTVFIIIKDI